LIEKIKDCTTKFIRDIGYWTKVVGYDSDNPKREFIHNGENYIGVCLIDNRFILERKKDSYADLAVNPLFLKKGEEKLQ
jgi:FPC/CPF motif-containing protein YcgG